MAPRVDMQEIGGTGLKRQGGRIYEEFLKELRGDKWQKVVREMSEQDPVIHGFLLAIELLLRQVPMEVETASDDAQAMEQAEFIDGALHDMSMSWPDTLSEILSVLPYGWCFMEIVYKRRIGPDEEDAGRRSKFTDNRIGWRKWSIRAQETRNRWEFDESGGVQGMWQMPPPDYTPRLIPIEKALLFRTTGRKNSPEGKSVLRGSYRCYSDDTEVLTRNGWKPIADVDTSMEVAALNPDTDELYYTEPTRSFAYPYEGKMFHQKGRYLDLLVTPNHNMWVRPVYGGEYRFVEAQEASRHVVYKRNATWIGEEQETFEIPIHEWQQWNGAKIIDRELSPRQVPMDDWLQFLGYWMAEGHAYRKQNGTRQAYIGITQNPGESHDRMYDSMAAVGLNPNSKTKTGGSSVIEATSVQVHELLKKFGNSGDKYVPQYVKELSPRQIRIFLDAFFEGDGGYMGVSKSRVYATISKRLADDLSELILKAGAAASVRWRPPQKKNRFSGDGIWIITEHKPCHFETHVNSQSDNREWVNYDGNVYCLEVPPHHLLYVRRNGKSCWSGNSWYFKKNIENIEGIGIERDLAGLPVAYIPPEYMSTEATAEQQALYNTIKEIVVNIRRDEQEGVVFPNAYEEGNRQFELTLLSTGGQRQFDTDSIIARYDQRIAMSVLADFILLGHENVGSFALSATKTSMFKTALEAYTQSIAGVINSHAIPRLLKLNGMDVSDPPQVKFGAIGKVELADLLAFVDSVSTAGMPLFPDVELENHLRNELGLPLLDDEQIAEREEQDEPDDAPQDEEPDDEEVPFSRYTPDELQGMMRAAERIISRGER